MTTTLTPTMFAPTRSPSTAGPVAIHIEGLSKRFLVRRRWAEMLRHPWRHEYATAVHSLSCDIRFGEFFGLLGANGAGKTTVFKMLLTSTTPDAGRIVVHGHDVVRDAAKVRALVGCIMANDRSLYWRLSATENLRLYAALYNMHGARARDRVRDLLRVVELDDAGDKMVAEFSTGMKQRLLIARALLSEPRVLLLDEPTRSLDPLSARRFRDFLRTEIAGHQGCTVLLATHSSEEAMELCDRVAVLDRGNLLALGTTAELGQQFGDQRFRIWTRSPEHPALASLAAQGRVGEVAVLPAEEPGWSCVQIAVPGGLEGAERILDYLKCAGMDIAQFERATMTLADLIERVIKSGRTERGAS